MARTGCRVACREYAWRVDTQCSGFERSYEDVRRALLLRRCHRTRSVLIKAFKGCLGY